MITRRFAAVLVAGVSALAIGATISQLRAARIIRRTQSGWDLPVPYWPVPEDALLLTVLCPPCRGRGGTCSCAIQCGQPECMGGFSDEDIEFLGGLSMPEGTDQ